MKKLTRLCMPCDQLTSKKECPACGADTDRWPADDSETDREYQARAKSPADQSAGRQ